MGYSTVVISREQQRITNWSGGTTAEIAIWPPEADYAKRNFIWRLSAARVDLDESTFTSLPGIKRILMVTGGAVKLIHEGHHQIQLDPFDQDCFCGDWLTKCVGRASDFNLMMAEGCEGTLCHVCVPGEKAISINADVPAADNACHAILLYCVDGAMQFTVGEKLFSLATGDTLLVRGQDATILPQICVANTANNGRKLIRTDLWWREEL